MAAPEQPVMRFVDVVVFEAWMEDNHAVSDGIWIEFAKKGSGHRSVVYAEVLDVALCFGWIDGQAKAVDDAWYRQRWTPRRPRSPWSLRNVGKAQELIAAGRMRPAGHAEIERAKADGRWDRAYAGPATMGVPDDLQAVLDADPAAAAFWETLPKTARYSFLYRLHEAKREETRARRLSQYAQMLREGRRLDRP
jgi:uncharacterized protein YdeI (YjbR/CyaY-like superfamily)